MAVQANYVADMSMGGPTNMTIVCSMISLHYKLIEESNNQHHETSIVWSKAAHILT